MEDSSAGEDASNSEFASPSSGPSKKPAPPPPSLRLEGEPMTLGTSSGNATGSGRTKVALKPGRSLMDWIKLTSKSEDLAGTGGRLLDVTPEQLAKHNTPEDC